MYRDDYRDRRDDLSRDLDSAHYLPPPRDLYYEERVRERSYSDYDDLDRKRYSLTLDDPYYRHRLDDLDPPPRRSRMSHSDSLPPLPPLPSMGTEEPTQDHTTGVIVCGSVILVPPSPFEKRPNLRVRPSGCRTVFVGSLPDNANSKHLQEVFSKCGKVSDVRVAKGRNFGHVQFEREEEVEKALKLSGCRIRVGPATSYADSGKIHVDYAQPRDNDINKKVVKTSELPYNGTNAGLVSSDLHDEDTFFSAATNIKTWIEKGNCNPNTTTSFFGLISSCNTHSRKLLKKMRDLGREDEDFASIRKKKYEHLVKECKPLFHERVFVNITNQA